MPGVIGVPTIPAPPTDAQNHRRRTRRRGFGSATPEEIGFIKPMIAMCVTANSESGATLCMPAPAARKALPPRLRLRWKVYNTVKFYAFGGGNMPLMRCRR
ncbi:hypothetical protein KCP70_07835 [Salmonella enterica subsp. enterica]|nr:hypothetical protein KCP70_07835 [Salmonella enterica subsp. enterica]